MGAGRERPVGSRPSRYTNAREDEMIQRDIEKRARGGARWALVAVLALFSGFLAGCDDILDVELPGQITEEATFTPDQASVLVGSAIAEIECSFSDFIATTGSGYEDVYVRITGWMNGVHEYDIDPSTSNCNTSDTSRGWFTPLHSGRWMGEQVYQRLNEEWTVEEVPNRETLMTQAALYVGLAYTQLGEYFCETTANTGPLMTWQETLSEAEDWYATALQHVGNTGDFAIPNGVSPSVEQTAYLLRARTRLAAGDEDGALADAEQIEQGFEAFFTREGGGDRKRWNRTVNLNHDFQLNSVLGPIDGWTGPPNPVTGEDWPAVIPFTGYRNLGIMPDGRAVSDTGHPITTTDEATAVADTRVPVVDQERTSNGFPVWYEEKYGSLDDDIPMAKWQEAWLIRAEIEGGATAIELVNDIRADAGLPEISGTYEADLLADADLLEDMLLEEIRRVHFLEGRFWSTKLRHMDKLWFPRGTGSTPNGHNYSPGVRMVMPEGEYELNENLQLTDRGASCSDLQNPL